MGDRLKPVRKKEKRRSFFYDVHPPHGDSDALLSGAATPTPPVPAATAGTPGAASPAASPTVAHEGEAEETGAQGEVSSIASRRGDDTRRLAAFTPRDSRLPSPRDDASLGKQAHRYGAHGGERIAPATAPFAAPSAAAAAAAVAEIEGSAVGERHPFFTRARSRLGPPAAIAAGIASRGVAGEGNSPAGVGEGSAREFPREGVRRTAASPRAGDAAAAAAEGAATAESEVTGTLQERLSVPSSRFRPSGSNVGSGGVTYERRYPQLGDPADRPPSEGEAGPYAPGKERLRVGSTSTAAASAGEKRLWHPGEPEAKNGGNAGDKVSDVSKSGAPPSEGEPFVGAEGHQEGQLGTDYMRNVPIILGIPLYTVKAGITQGSTYTFLFFFFGCFYVLGAWRNANVLRQDVPLPSSGLDATLHLRNCAVRILPLEENDEPPSFSSFPSPHTISRGKKQDASKEEASGSFWTRLWGEGDDVGLDGSLTDSGRGRSFMRLSAWPGFREPPPKSRDDSSGSRVRRQEPVQWRSATDLLVVLRMTQYHPWFRCSLTFYLEEGYEFNSFSIRFFPADRYVNLDASVPLRAKDRVHVDAFHTFLNFSSVEAPIIRLSLIDGHIDISLDGEAATYSPAGAKHESVLEVSSKTASVTVNSKHPLEIEMNDDAATRSLLRASGQVTVDVINDERSATAVAAEGIRAAAAGLGTGASLSPNKSASSSPARASHASRAVGTSVSRTTAKALGNMRSNLLWTMVGNNNGAAGESKGTSKTSALVTASLYPSDAIALFTRVSPVRLSFTCEQCALYANVRTADEISKELTMQTWVGRVHAEQPHLPPHAEERVKAAVRWMSEAPSAPWVVAIEPTASPQEAGIWRILSSNAYLNSVYWFVVLSGGALAPRTLHLPLPIMGLFCRSVIDLDEDELFANVITSAEEFIGKEGVYEHPRDGATSPSSRRLAAVDMQEHEKDMEAVDRGVTEHQETSRKKTATANALTAGRNETPSVYEHALPDIHATTAQPAYTAMSAAAENGHEAAGGLVLVMGATAAANQGDSAEVEATAAAREAPSASTSGDLGSAAATAENTSPPSYVAASKGMSGGGVSPLSSREPSANASNSDTSGVCSTQLDEAPGKGPAPQSFEDEIERLAEMAAARRRIARQEILSRRLQYYEAKKKYEEQLKEAQVTLPYYVLRRRSSRIAPYEADSGRALLDDRARLGFLQNEQEASARVAALTAPSDCGAQGKMHTHLFGVDQKQGRIPDINNNKCTPNICRESFPSFHQDSTSRSQAHERRLSAGAAAPRKLRSDSKSMQAAVNPQAADDQSTLPLGQFVGGTQPLTACINEVIEDTFLVLWNAFSESHTSSTFYVWARQQGAPEYIFSVLSDALVKDKTGARHTWHFLAAIVINILSAMTLAGVSVYLLYCHLIPTMKKKDREDTVLRGASHRLDHEATGMPAMETANSVSTWSVMVARVYSPCVGLLLRWSAAETSVPYRLGIQLRPAECAWVEAEEEFAAAAVKQRYASKEVYLYLPGTAVETVHQLGLNQLELFLPAQHPGLIEMETAQHYKLDATTKYRVRVTLFSSHGRTIGQSRWSPEVIVGGDLTFTDYPLLAMRRMLPSRFSSLEIFLRKFTYVAAHFSIPVTLADVKLHIFDLPPELKGRPLTRHPFGSSLQLLRPKAIDRTSIQRLATAVRTHAEACCLDYIVSAHFGYKAQLAKEVALRTGRGVYSEIRFRGVPEVIGADPEAHEQQSYLEMEAPKSCVRLLKDRIAHVSIGFEVTAHQTGQVVATGSIRFDDLYQVARESISSTEGGEHSENVDGAPSNAGRFRIGLEYIDGGGPWGRLECTLDIENIRGFIRHYEKDEASGTGPRRRPRLRSTVQFRKIPRGAGGDISGTLRPEVDIYILHCNGALHALDTIPCDGQPCAIVRVEGHDDRRRRLSRVDGTPGTILAQLGLLNNEPAAGRFAADTSPGRTASVELVPQQMETGKHNGLSVKSSTPLEGLGNHETLKVPLLESSSLRSRTSCSRTPSFLAGLQRAVGSTILASATRSRAGGSPLGSGWGVQRQPSLLATPEARPHFTRDSPGRPVLQGSDLFVQWVWPPTAETSPDHVYLSLFSHENDSYLTALHWGKPVPNTGSYAWGVDAQFKPGQHCQLVYIAMSLEPPMDGRLTPSAAVCQSNAFYIVHPVPLSELELVYASFCRTHGLEMEHMSDTILSRYGFETRENMLKICQDLRPPLCTEPQEVTAVHTPGQCLISTQSKLVMHERDAADTPAAACDEKQVVVYKSISTKVKSLENLGLIRDLSWWTETPDIFLLNNDFLYHSALAQQGRLYLSRSWVLKLLGSHAPSVRRALAGRQSRGVWTLSRWLEFKALPVLVTVCIIGGQIGIFFFFPILLFLFSASQDYYLAEASRTLRKQTNDVFLSDLVLHPSFKTLSQLPGADQFVLLFSFLYIIVMTIATFFNVFLRQRFPSALHYLDLVGRGLLTISVFATTWALSTFVLWFLLGALINSDSFLPYAAMLGSIVFVVGYLWMNFLTSREGVTKFIEGNMQLLLSLALDHWFATMNITYTGKEQTPADEMLLTYSESIRDELRDGRLRLQREYQLERVAEAEETSDAASSAARYRAGHHSFRQHPEKLAIYVLDKYVAPKDHEFFFDEQGVPHGLEAIPSLPDGARFATVAEVERHAEKVDDMLGGWESAMLKDGVKYGPRLGYKIENQPQPKQSYGYAILALPKYPPPEELHDSLKAQMVFSYFSKDGKDYLSKSEFIYFLRKLRDGQADEHNWGELCEYFNDIANTQIDPARGITLQDLLKIYSLQSGELDRDYEKLYPIVKPEDLEEDLEDIEHSDTEEMSAIQEEEVVEYEETTSDEEEEAPEVQDVDEEAEQKPVSHEEEKIQVELKANLNARKLQFIYNYTTQESRGAAIDELITSVPFLASKILETHMLLLAPVFGKDALLGGSGAAAGSAQRLGRLSAVGAAGGFEDPATARKEDRFVTLLKMLHLEFIQELSRQFRLVHTAMFESHNVRSKVQDFYDNVFPQKVSMKASRLLNESLELTKADVFSSNAEALSQSPPKTANQLLRALQKYRIEQDQTIKQTLMLIWRAQGALQVQLQVHLVSETICAHKLLPADHFVSATVQVPAEGGQTSEIEVLYPREQACLKLITDALDKQLGGRLQRMTSATQLVQVVDHIISRNLWFDCFTFLVQLMGNDINVDVLPGGAVGVEEYGGETSPAEQDEGFGYHSGDMPEDATQKRRRLNLLRMRAVFDQLSNKSGFLPLSLVDEAVQLLTDNRLNFSGVIACLQHLKIGTVYTEDRGDVLHAFERLGLRRDSPVCHIEYSNEEVTDVLDWTTLRKDPRWTPELFRAFDRLTSSCPGYMGKSQMFEFVREIHKLFQPQVSELRRGRDRLRGRKQGPKAGIAQLGGFTQEQALRHLGSSDGVQDTQVLVDAGFETADDTMRMVSFEMFHKVATKLGLSISHKHSRIIWNLISLDSTEEIQQFLPESEVKLGLIRIYFQPVTSLGKLARNRDPVAAVSGYKGYVTFVLFRRVLRQLGVLISDKAARIMWDDLPKDCLDITEFLPPGLTGVDSPTKYLKVDMDKTGMDPMRGRVASILVVRKRLPRMLMTGLWPDAIRVLIKLSLQLDVSESHISAALAGTERQMNRYGLTRPEEVASILSSLSVGGMDFTMLRDVIQKMRVMMPDQDIKRMFDLMDINQDLTLSLGELLTGFEILFGRLMPVLVLNEVGLSNERMLLILCTATLGLLAFFGFLGLAFSSFESLKSGVSTAVQSLLAVLGALGLQSSASQEIEQIQEKMKTQIETIMGDQLSRAKEQAEELQEAIKPEPPIKEGKPTKLRYILPRKYRPDVEDPRPCVTFSPGNYVLLEPTVSGRFDREKLRWSISPQIPKKTGLTFNLKTGVIEGTIPAHEEHSSSFISTDRRAFRQTPSARAEMSDVALESSGTEGVLDLVPSAQVHLGQSGSGMKPLRVARRTYTVVVRNAAGSARARVTFQAFSAHTLPTHLRVDNTTEEACYMYQPSSRPSAFFHIYLPSFSAMRMQVQRRYSVVRQQKKEASSDLRRDFNKKHSIRPSGDS